MARIDRPVPFCIEYPGRGAERFGDGAPEFTIRVLNRRGERALASLSELRLCEAYMDGDVDIVGDMRKAVVMRQILDDQDFIVQLSRRITAPLFGLRRAHESWVQAHYDLDNLQLHFLDRDYNTYTPGVFEHEDESLERASERKLQLAFDGLGLEPGDHVLEIGFGWGSFLRYAARRGVHVTGVTLSRHQLAYVRETLLEGEGLDADLHYSDFFDFEPGRRFDAVVMVGVIEELADFHAVMQRIARWLEPGRRAYIDFMAATRHFVFPAFISKYIYRGLTCRVYMPRFVEAVTQSPFEMLAVHNDRRNYYLTAAHWFDNYERAREQVRAQFGERVYRMFRMYLAGAANMLDDPSHLTTAYRVFLELPADAKV